MNSSLISIKTLHSNTYTTSLLSLLTIHVYMCLWIMWYLRYQQCLCKKMNIRHFSAFNQPTLVINYSYRCFFFLLEMNLFFFKYDNLTTLFLYIYIYIYICVCMYICTRWTCAVQICSAQLLYCHERLDAPRVQLQECL